MEFVQLVCIKWWLNTIKEKKYMEYQKKNIMANKFSIWK